MAASQLPRITTIRTDAFARSVGTMSRAGVRAPGIGKRPALFLPPNSLSTRDSVSSPRAYNLSKPSISVKRVWSYRRVSRLKSGTCFIILLWWMSCIGVDIWASIGAWEVGMGLVGHRLYCLEVRR